MKTVRLHGKRGIGRVALVDDEDFDLVMQYRWHVYERPAQRCGPYAVAHQRLGYRGAPKVSMHKLITGYPLTDHINHDGLDNQRHNLRIATTFQNQQNRRADLGGTSEYKGVCWDRERAKWGAYIAVNGCRRHLGRFVTEIEAAIAYDAAAFKAWGEYAYLNFPTRSPEPR